MKLIDIITKENETYEEQIDANKIATAIYITQGTEEYGKKIYLDLDDGNVFTTSGSETPNNSNGSWEKIIYIGKACGEFGSDWECEAHYETLTDEDGDEYEGDFLGYTADDGESFYDTREEAIAAWIEENGLDANQIDAILDMEGEIK